MDGRGVQQQTPAAANAVSSRLVWRLFSPSFRLVSCVVARENGAFKLTVECGDQVLASCQAPDLESLHARASDWRAQLETHGYVATSSVRDADVRPASRPGEARAAFLGLLECAAVLELRHPQLARRLRDRVTEGLVAVGLSDSDFIRQTVALSRDVLSAVPPVETDGDLIRSCLALLERVEVTLP